MAVANALPDIIGHDLDVLFCGINPGLAAAATGHHFVGRGNRFWQVLHLAGFTSKRIRPEQDCTILDYGCGLTSLVARPTARADQVSTGEFMTAVPDFEAKLARYRPRFVAFLGKAAYLALSGRRDVLWGKQGEVLVNSAIWILPNPSGRNRAFTLAQLVSAYRELNTAASSGLCRRVEE